MARSVKKDRYINYTKEEFLEKYQISDNKFKDNISKVCSIFNIKQGLLKRDGEEFKKDSSSVYEIKYEIADLLALMFKNYNKSLFNGSKGVRKNKTMMDFIEYNKNIIEDIDKLPEYLQYDIKKHNTYELIYSMTELMPIIINRLSAFFNIILTEEPSKMNSILSSFVDDLDILLAKYSRKKLMVNWYKKRFNYNFKVEEYNYNINKVIKDCFNKFIQEDTEYLKLNELIEEIYISEDDLNPEEISCLRKRYLEKLNKYYINDESNYLIKEKFKRAKENVAKIKNIKNIKKNTERYYFDKNEIKEKLKLDFSNYITGIQTVNCSINYNGIDLVPFLYRLEEESIKFMKNRKCELCWMCIEDDYENYSMELLDKSYNCLNNSINYKNIDCSFLHNMDELFAKFSEDIYEIDKNTYESIENQLNQLNHNILHSIDIVSGQTILGYIDKIK